MRLDGYVTLVNSLLADLFDHPLNRLKCDVQVREFDQIARRLLIRYAVDAGVDNFLLHAQTEPAMVKSQRLILREKKPADSGGNLLRVVSSRHLPSWS